jgi:hypothetical protein
MPTLWIGVEVSLWRRQKWLAFRRSLLDALDTVQGKTDARGRPVRVELVFVWRRQRADTGG